MRIARLAVLAAALLGCGHARETEPTVETVGHASPPEDRPHGGPQAPAPGTPPPVDQPPPLAHTPLSTSPGGLLKPGGAGKIQDKLSGDGLLPEQHEAGTLDGPTQEALRRFQRDHDLPATGVPDDATVRKLGLRPDDVFKSDR